MEDHRHFYASVSNADHGVNPARAHQQSTENPRGDGTGRLVIVHIMFSSRPSVRSPRRSTGSGRGFGEGPVTALVGETRARPTVGEGRWVVGRHRQQAWLRAVLTASCATKVLKGRVKREDSTWRSRASNSSLDWSFPCNRGWNKGLQMGQFLPGPPHGSIFLQANIIYHSIYSAGPHFSGILRHTALFCCGNWISKVGGDRTDLLLRELGVFEGADVFAIWHILCQVAADSIVGFAIKDTFPVCRALRATLKTEKITEEQSASIVIVQRSAFLQSSMCEMHISQEIDL
ncbi:hypothetical protein GOBAR_AA09318 [Gossypium barbadense]|uniref:Uncharacterized protein n=1 Tax=Gossypium barbadense TaxID=3634 RepID=A0A2P5Y6X6_GOSBA|nr:hypothetical protein GOBAR_AA09318 [Gossypium barbadense]